MTHTGTHSGERRDQGFPGQTRCSSPKTRGHSKRVRGPSTLGGLPMHRPRTQSSRTSPDRRKGRPAHHRGRHDSRQWQTKYDFKYSSPARKDPPPSPHTPLISSETRQSLRKRGTGTGVNIRICCSPDLGRSFTEERRFSTGVRKKRR